MADESEPLMALLEIMLRTFSVPKVQAGGYPDDIFIQLPDEEREELECAICFQILKEARQCENKHKFCYSCIFVWSTGGNPVNHSRCPVCRVEGNYVRNHDLDDTIQALVVKCSMKTCNWTGRLKYLQSHQHTTYSGSRSTQNTEATPELPALRSLSSHRPSSNTRANSNTTTTHASASSSTLTSRRQPLANTTNTATPRANSVGTRQSDSNTTTARRTRTRHRQNSVSPQRRSTVTATGLPNRLTSRARIQNGGQTTQTVSRSRAQAENVDPTSQSSIIQNGGQTAQTSSRPRAQAENINTTSQSSTNLTPRPPTTPRPNNARPRRVPTLPTLVTTPGSIDPSSIYGERAVDANNNVDVVYRAPLETPGDTGLTVDTPRQQYTVEAAINRRATAPTTGFGVVRDRLNESRQRLDLLMNAFSVEIDRGRQDLTAFQQERERRRQEQLSEVRDLGRRLGQVAQELRGLLSQRRQIRTQIDHLVDSVDDDDDSD